MFNKETSKSLAPRSWLAVTVWLVLIGVVATHPIASGKATFAFLGGASQWVGYTAFADCGIEPPIDWMTPKPCPPPDAVLEGKTPPEEAPPPDELDPNDEPQDAAPRPDDGYVVRVDSNSIRSVLDRGTDTVLALHHEVSEVQANGGLTVNIGDRDEQGGGP